MIIAVDKAATAGYPYHVTVGLKNVADVPIYNAALELLKDGKKNYIYQPLEQLTMTAAELRPGASISTTTSLSQPLPGHLTWANVRLKISGRCRSARHDHKPPTRRRPRERPKGHGHRTRPNCGISWDPIPGATDHTDYEVFSTPSPDQDFPSTPVANVTWLPNSANGQLKAYVSGLPNGETRYYAISPIVAGQPSMTHPLTAATASDQQTGQQASVTFDDKNGTEHTCGESTVNATFTFGDDFFGIQSYTVSLGGSVAAEKGNLSQPTVTTNPPVPISVPATGSVTVTAQATNSAGLHGPVISRTLDRACPVHQAVVVAMGLNSNLSDPLDSPITPVIDSACTPPSGRDAFDMLAVTNACDDGSADPDSHGNLVAYLTSRGYDPGATRASPNRTLLEFSYQGATVNCGAKGDVGPTFIPNNYTSFNTWTELAQQVLPKITGTARHYFDAMEQYSDCWKDRYGIKLQYSIIGHSEGGYEALGIANAAADAAESDPSRAGLVSSVVTVDGAVNPTAVLEDLNIGDCFAGGSALQLPEDVAGFYAKTTKTYQGLALINYLSGRTGRAASSGTPPTLASTSPR